MFNIPDIREAGDRPARDQARRLSNSNIPTRFRGLEWDDIDVEPEQDIVRAWVDLVVSGQVMGNPRSDWFGKGLLLHGSPGTGKTTLAMVALQAILRQATLATWGPSWTRKVHPIKPAHVEYYRNVISLAQRRINHDLTEVEEQRIEHMFGYGDTEYAYRLLLLDDVGKEYQSGSTWASGWFEELIRMRYYSDLPTIVTTNAGPEQWEDIYGRSCASFMHEAFISLALQTNFDRRKLDA